MQDSRDLIKAFRKIIILSFPQEQVQKPVVCNLTRLFDLTFNIVQAKVTPRREGFMTLELVGTEDNYRKGIEYLKEAGIAVSSASQKIDRDEEVCTQCGMCTAICPVDALFLDVKSRKVVFDKERCTACGLCIHVCPMRAMEAEVEALPWN